MRAAASRKSARPSLPNMDGQAGKGEGAAMRGQPAVLSLPSRFSAKGRFFRVV
jgi:hypothetical protein